jgi:hypothetical protein
MPNHPQLPVQPSQLPGRGDAFPIQDRPTPERPALPKRGEPVPAATQDRPPLPTRVTQPASDPAATQVFASPTAAPPTMAYPTMHPTPAPDLQVSQNLAPTVGFVSPDGNTIPAPQRPASPNPNGWGAALASMPPPPAPPAPAQDQEREGAPIFLQMQQSWFKGQDGPISEEWSMPTAGYAPPPNQPPQAAAPVTAPAAVAAPVAAAPAARPAPVSPPAPAEQPVSRRENAGQNGSRSVQAEPDSGSQSVPRPRRSAEDAWRTAADDGWQRAMAAAEPTVNDTTRSGLPKRVPQAQLVPGGVQSSPRNQNRRSPDEVRGLLSAYHRGVQRGRTAGSEEAVADAPAPKEN